MLLLCFTASEWATLIGAFGGALLGAAGSLCIYYYTEQQSLKKGKQKKIELLNTAYSLLEEICALQDSILSALKQYVDAIDKEPQITPQLKEVPLSLFLRFQSLNIEQILNAWNEVISDNQKYVTLFNSFDFIYNTLSEIYEANVKNNTEIEKLSMELFLSENNMVNVVTADSIFKNNCTKENIVHKNQRLSQHIKTEFPKLEEAFSRINTIMCEIRKTITKSK